MLTFIIGLVAGFALGLYVGSARTRKAVKGALNRVTQRLPE